MTRRGLLQVLGAAIAAPLVGLQPDRAGLQGHWIADYSGTMIPVRYGAMTIERHAALKSRGLHLRVIHQGRDVTDRCRFADDTGEGMAELFLHNAEGRPYLEPPVKPGECKIYRWDGARAVCITPERRVATEIVSGVTFRADG